MSKYVVQNGNNENDKMMRKGLSDLYAETKMKKQKQEILKIEGKKEELLNWLFSGKENDSESPLK